MEKPNGKAINLDLYRVFYTVARCGSITRAAEELYISQPAVSQSIKQLETALGTPLFIRRHKGIELTSLGGELIFGDVEKAMDLLGGLEGKVTEIKRSAKGTLRIGASETIFQYILADTIVQYHEKYPQVTLDLISDVSPAIMERLVDDRCDVGFLNLPIDVAEGIRVSESVTFLNDIFIAGKEYERLRGVRIEASELQSYPLILLKEGTVSRMVLSQYCDRIGINLRPTVEVDSWGLMKQLVQEGMGIGCIPREYTRNRLRNGSVFELDLNPPMSQRSIGMAFPKHANLPFSLRAFIALLRKNKELR